MDAYWGSCLELCMPPGFVKGHSLANRGLPRRYITNSLFQVNSRQGQGLLYAPICWTPQEKGKWKWHLNVQKAGIRWRGPGPGISSRQKGDKTQHPRCLDLRTRRASEVLAAKGPKTLHVDMPSSIRFSGRSQSSSDLNAHLNPLGILLK